MLDFWTSPHVYRTVKECVMEGRGQDNENGGEVSDSEVKNGARPVCLPSLLALHVSA